VLRSAVSSTDPVLLLASGMNVPDDLLYVDADGSVLVGEHGDGHIARVGGAIGFERLPQVVGQTEGIAQVGGVTYVADQVQSRVLALTATGLQTLIQLQPDPNGLNVDGIASDAKGTGLVVPDSPHGTVLFVDTSGNITGQVGGFSRPAGVSVDPQGGGYLIADEDAGVIFAIPPGATRPTRLVGNLPGVDDVIRDGYGHLLAILPGLGTIRDTTSGVDLVAGLRNPQGLGFDGAQNVLVTESDNGTLDLVVRTFAVQVPSGIVQLAAGQTVCVGVLRAPGFTAPVAFKEVVGGLPMVDPTGGAVGEVLPSRCNQPTCTVTMLLASSVGTEYARFTYRD
jgi:DNA-binding beta-propeller fold protein YncE